MSWLGRKCQSSETKMFKGPFVLEHDGPWLEQGVRSLPKLRSCPSPHCAKKDSQEEVQVFLWLQLFLVLEDKNSWISVHWCHGLTPLWNSAHTATCSIPHQRTRKVIKQQIRKLNLLSCNGPSCHTCKFARNWIKALGKYSELRTHTSEDFICAKYSVLCLEQDIFLVDLPMSVKFHWYLWLPEVVNKCDKTCTA